MSELPPNDPALDASERDLSSLLLATYFVAMIVVVVALLVVPTVL
jgi:hypothetical protein